MAIPEQWTKGQRERVDVLRSFLPDRPWWIVLGPEDVDCWPKNTFLHHTHTTWHSAMPPCSRVPCLCVVRAMTDAQARREGARREEARRRLKLPF